MPNPVAIKAAQAEEKAAERKETMLGVCGLEYNFK